jgi:hypothetical protein
MLGQFNFEVHHPLKSATRGDYWEKSYRGLKNLPCLDRGAFGIEIIPGSVVANLSQGDALHF